MNKLTALLCLALAACGGSAEPEQQPVATGGTAESLTEQMDRAKAVEETVLKRKLDIDDNLDKTAGDLPDNDDPR